jgi:hypothetical protein
VTVSQLETYPQGHTQWIEDFFHITRGVYKATTRPEHWLPPQAKRVKGLNRSARFIKKLDGIPKLQLSSGGPKINPHSFLSRF